MWPRSEAKWCELRQLFLNFLRQFFFGERRCCRRATQPQFAPLSDAMPIRQRLPGVAGEAPPPFIDASSSRTTLYCYAKNIHAGWTRTYALMGEQQVSLDRRDRDISENAQQIADLSRQLDVVGISRRIDIHKIRNKHNSLKSENEDLRRQLE